MKTYTFPERRVPVPGPWDDEPDKAQWIDPDTELDCLTVRNGHSGSWCGYVGVLPGHKWHGVEYDKLGEYPDVHGGLTYSNFCMEGAEEGPGVCHVPAPGRPANVWWLGFDCAHAFDLMPTMEARMAELWKTVEDIHPDPYPKAYRTFEYVRGECADLARQIKAAQ